MDLSSLPANDLARLCSDAGSVEAWNEFIRRFKQPISLAILRIRRGSPSIGLVDDLVQETFLRLCANDCRLLKNFVASEPDSIIRYLRRIAANVACDHFRSEKTRKRGGDLKRVENERGDLDFLIAAPGQENPAEKSLFMGDIDRTLQSFVPHIITERDITIFWLYYEQGFSAREIGAIASFGLGVKGVESSIHRTTKELKEAIGT